jgi:hypothetical protein
MVLTKSELVASLKNDVRILLHLAGKVDPAQLDYRPTPKQRSTLDLLRYLSMMGPQLVRGIKAGTFDETAWTAAETAAGALTFDQALAAIAAHDDLYAALLAGFADAHLRAEIDLFGEKVTRGAALVNWVLCAEARRPPGRHRAWRPAARAWSTRTARTTCAAKAKKCARSCHGVSAHWASRR